VRFRILLFALATGSVALPAHAELISYHAEGYLTAAGFGHDDANGNPQPTGFEEALPVGSLYTYDLVVDTTVPGHLDYYGRLVYSDHLVGVTLNLNGLIYTMTSPHANFWVDMPSTESFGVFSANFDGPEIEHALPGAEVLLSGGGLFMAWFGPEMPSGFGGPQVRGIGTSFSRVTPEVTDVPEPMTVALLAAGIAIGGGRKLTKRRTVRMRI
jgi:hypothetical protein